jgi:hypothetical protein
MPSDKNNKTSISLTPKEEDRIRQATQTRLSKCRADAGQPRHPVVSKNAQNLVATATFLADITVASGNGIGADEAQQQDTIPVFTIGSPYPPYTAKLDDLQSMKLEDLRMETHHRGYALYLRRAAPVVKLRTRSWTVVQQERSDDAERLEVFLHTIDYGGVDVLEAGEAFAIKEPYFTRNEEGQQTLRIDHPSDLVNLDGPGFHQQTLQNGDSERTAKQCKEEGNAFLKQRDLRQAYASYASGLHLLSTSNNPDNASLKRDIYRNRSHVNLLLHRFDEAKMDALASLILDGNHDDSTSSTSVSALNSKAYFRAACATYNLHKFSSALSFCTNLLNLTPDDKDGFALSQKIRTRLHEQETGNYPFLNNPKPPSSSFPNQTTIQLCSNNPEKGRGLFATSSIPKGNIILCEKAFCSVFSHEKSGWTAMVYDTRSDLIRWFPAGLLQAVVKKMRDNPSLAEEVRRLFGDYKASASFEGGAKGWEGCRGGEEEEEEEEEEAREGVVDVWEVHDVIQRNAFGITTISPSPPLPLAGKKESPGQQAARASTCLYIRASYINHSCVPNAKAECVGDVMVYVSLHREP